MGRRLAALTGLILAAATVGGVPAVPAASGAARGLLTEATDLPPGIVLPLSDFSDLVADPVRGREYVSSAADSAVVVADDKGRVLGTVKGLTGATELVPSPDGGSLFVALSTGHAIAVVDTSTLTKRTIELGPHACPRDVSVTAGLVWYLDRCSVNAHRTIGAVDPSTGEVHRFQVGLTFEDQMYASPYLRDQLVTGRRRYAVTGGASPTLRGLHRIDRTSLAVTADGRRLVTGPDVLDLRGRLVDTYPGDSDSVAVRADGAVAMNSGTVDIYAPGENVAARHYQFTNPSAADQTVPPGGLAFGRTDLFAVATTGAYTTSHTVRLVDAHVDTSPGSWEGGRGLPIIAAEQLQADPLHDQAFVIGGENDTSLVVLNHQARVTRVLQHMPGPTDMVLSDDRRTLFVLLSRTSTVAAVDTRTLRVHKFPLGARTCPSDVAYSAGLVWFSTTCADIHDDKTFTWGEYLGALNPTSGKVYRRLLGPAPSELMASPSLPGTLFAGYGVFGGDVRRRYSVTGGAHPAARQVRQSFPAYFEDADVSLSPDGLSLVSGQVDVDGQFAQSTRDFSLTGLVPSPDPVVAVAVRDDGLTALGTDQDADDPRTDTAPAYNVGLSAHPVGPLTQTLRLHDHGIYRRGLSFGRRDLFALTGGINGRQVRVWRMPAVRPVSISAERVAYVSGDRALVAAHVAAPGPAARRVVAIYARPAGATRAHLAERGRTDSAGNLRAHLTVKVNTTVRVRVSGLSTSVRVPVAVRLRDDVRDLAGVTTSNDYMPTGSRPAFVAHVTPAHVHQCLTVRLERMSAHGWKLFGHPVCTRLDRHGHATYVLPDRRLLSGQVRVRSEWAGDARNSPILGVWHVVTFL